MIMEGKVCYIHSRELLLKSELNHRVNKRSDIVHTLIEAYGLLEHLDVIPPVSSSEGVSLFHSADYIQYLKTQDQDETTSSDEDDEYGIGYDCPPFPGLYSYVCFITGASLSAARALVSGEYQVAINWYGGRHHGNRDKASGFCYCNDVVVCILYLLKHYPRVLYMDLDIHHGDGVEQAFYYSDRVVTVSLHKYSPGFFPGTGSFDSVGSGNGLYHTVNLPLEDGITDEQYTTVFRSISEEVYQRFKPCAVVIQCGADCLTGDPLGTFNLSLSGLGQCLETVLQWKLPTVVLGGGGYNLANTARCWAYLTSLILGQAINGDIPEHKFFNMYKPGYQLHLDTGSRLNKNTPASITELITRTRANLTHIDVE